MQADSLNLNNKNIIPTTTFCKTVENKTVFYHYVVIKSLHYHTSC